MNAKKPKFKVTYAGHDATEEISRELISISYTDRTKGNSDEVEITMHDTEGKWRDSWYPAKGDKIEFEFGYEDEMIPAGIFEVDEMEISGPPDTITIRAQAAGVNSPLRTKKSKAFEDQTLLEIAKSIADAHGYKIEDGTARSNRTVFNYDKEKKAISEAAAAIQSLYTRAKSFLLGEKQSAHKVSIDKELRDSVNRYYQPLIDAARSLKTKGREKDGVEILTTIDLWVKWAQNWTEIESGMVMQAAGAVVDFISRLNAIAASLVNIDKVTTSTRLSVRVARATQDNQSDLDFLARTSEKYGMIFSIRGDTIVFTPERSLEQDAPHTLTFTRTDLISYTFGDKATKSYKSARVRYCDPVTGETVEGSADNILADRAVTDVLEIRGIRAENQQQAEEQAKARLYQANSKAQEGTISVTGTPYLLAGVNIRIDGIGVLSGTWAVVESTHSMDGSGGYVTEAGVKRV